MEVGGGTSMETKEIMKLRGAGGGGGAVVGTNGGEGMGGNRGS